MDGSLIEIVLRASTPKRNFKQAQNGWNFRQNEKATRQLWVTSSFKGE
jgi:hypothetical protein